MLARTLRGFCEMHKDFQRASKLNTTEEMMTFIDKTVKDHKVVLFMKGVPKRPMCGYSNFAVELLKKYQVHDFRGVNVLEDNRLRETVKVFSNWPTFPQLYINGKLIGGSDIMNQLEREGQFQQLLEDEKVI